jgi:Xaa-Pro dipeptidase
VKEVLMDGHEFKEFSKEEFELRCKKARNLMAQKDIDWLLVSDEANFRYFTGCTPPTKNRPAFFFLPLEGKPFILSATFSANAFRNMSWVPHVIEYKVPITAESIQNALVEAGAREVRVGTEQNDFLFGGFRMNLPFDEFIRLREMMQDCDFVNGSEILWRLRLIKTPLEIEYLRKACEITGKAYEYVFRSLRVGMTEKESCRLLVEGMVKGGADIPTPGKSGPCSFIYADASRPLGQPHIPTDKKIGKGDILHIDTGAIYRGYHADFARLAVMGRPNDSQKRLWEKSANAILRSLKKIKPGALLGDIEVHWHGIGLEPVEYPFVERDKGKMMEKGMALGVETMIHSETGESFYLEQNIVITDSGYELLSTIQLDFFEIQ